MSVKLLIVCSFLLGFGSLHAQKKSKFNEYHVALVGKDGAVGTKENPLRTIMAAAKLAMPGDTITVHAGVYREIIVPPRGGLSEAKRITYRAAKGEKVVIRGSEEIKGWKLLENDVWQVELPNSFFAAFNPYQEEIRGDWFWPTPKERKYHRGAVYLNGHWLMEAESKQKLMDDHSSKGGWWASVDQEKTSIWARFPHTDPNQNQTEINVRPRVFYPDQPFVNFITVDGFVLEQAATNWAPPTAEQEGLLGTHWSKGWRIVNNTIQYSKCVGIALGKYGDNHDNKDTESAEGYVGTIKRALAFGWNKDSIGSHYVGNNKIAYCEQAGIVGSMGCSFSTVEHNTIHDIHIERLFTGAEMAGIKFHGAVDVSIRNNRIFRTNMGLWLDWMAQGAQITNNLFDHNDLDVFLEVTHGPAILANNIMLSTKNLLMNAQGAAFVHNLFAGKIEVVAYDSRLTPYLKPHSTELVALKDNPGGDVQFINNIFAKGADISDYNKAYLPVFLDGNIYLKGSIGVSTNKINQRMGEIHANAEQQMKSYVLHGAVEKNLFIDTSGVADVKIMEINGEVYLEFPFSKKWLKQKRNLVTSTSLLPTIISRLPFENHTGSALRIDRDYLGEPRKQSNPLPGPFENIKEEGGTQLIWSESKKLTR
ncbi:right-handed parallel beta-helix repeat-containing protein [Sphingobacterium sp. DR205]|uniref:NosD domain-containing protein n=1 Tax=Sphingobacterium sp. DR205 TaxID=2713573 RepID=UPI0013E4A049|nr:right-handed parallel beta-helix repeat-containing protein [Sphingobacterium sp. DR205]QIH32980.1 xylosidase [Sphingobacterium sp. DR205]